MTPILDRWRCTRNWCKNPYHFLLDLHGRVFEGRDWHTQGETNTTYDPGGHFLISMIGNYDVQEPSVGPLAAIADLTAWALKANSLPIDRIGGHHHLARAGGPREVSAPLSRRRNAASHGAAVWLHKMPLSTRDCLTVQRPDTRRPTRKRRATSRDATHGISAAPFGARSEHGSGLAAKTMHEIASLPL